MTADQNLRIGNYEIVTRIAIGGMAEIYLAWQTGPGGFRRQVVLKRIHPHMADDAEFVRMFVNEATIVAGFSHPNIVHVYELFEGEGSHFIAMEYVRGETVQALMREIRRKQIPFPIPYAIQIIAGVCEALEYAYFSPDAEGEPFQIVHRDVSPSNILVSLAGQVKLLDFGIAKAIAASGTTQVGQVKGKYVYMSPEQVVGGAVDHRSDIFTVGVVLYELLTGERVFRRPNDALTMQAILHDPIPPPSAIAEGFPPDLEAIILRCLERNPDQRYQRARDLAADLEQCADANDWTMKTATMASFVKALFPNRQERDGSNPTSNPSLRALAGAAGPGSGSARRLAADAPSSHPGTPASGADHWSSVAAAQPPPALLLPPSVPATASLSAPSTLPSASEVSAGQQVLAAEKRKDAIAYVVLAALLAASMVFWLLIYPRIRG